MRIPGWAENAVAHINGAPTASAPAPVLYCIESVDLPEGVDINNVYIPSDIRMVPKKAGDLPFGVTALEGDALYQPTMSLVDKIPVSDLCDELVPDY